jgi:hypothetical protein
MKKITILLTLQLFIVSMVIGQSITFTWSGGGGTNKNWKTPTNWVNSQTGMNDLSPVSSSTNNFIFNGSADVEMDIGTSYSMGSLTINGGTVVLTSTNTVSEMLFNAPLTLASGATLRLDGAFRNILTQNAVAATASISGTIDLAGTGLNTTNCGRIQGFSTFSGAQPLWTVNSGGKIIMSGPAAQMLGLTNDRMAFESGAVLEITRNGGTVPDCNYKTGSLIRVIGTGTAGSQLPNNASVRYDGDIEWNRPNQVGETTLNWPVSSIPDINGKITMKAGYLNFGGSSNSRFTNGTFKFGEIDVQGGILSMGSTATGSTTISTNVTVSGGTFRVANPSYTAAMTVNINGNIVQSGGIIDISSNTASSKLVLKGNITQSAGTLTETSTSSTPSFTFGGTALQVATFFGTVSGNNFIMTINNGKNHVSLLSNVTLPYRLQCSAGDMILGANNLTVTEKVFGSRTGGGIVTNGTGTLTLKNVDAVGKDFPVKTSSASHDAVYISNTTGTADYTVKVTPTILPPANLNLVTTLPRQWDILSTSTAANLEFDPDPSSGTIPADGSRSIGQYVTPFWNQATSTIGANIGYPFSNNFTSFTSFVVGTTNVIPVELTAFKAKATTNNNLLTWTTTTERHVNRFDIQRSNDGVSDWNTIGSVKAKGNSVASLTYEFADATPLATSYYRLQSVDVDGKTDVSKVVSVNRKSNGKLSLDAVNRAYSEGSFFHLDITLAERSNLRVALIDAVGRTVSTQNYTATEGVNTLDIPTNTLAKGIYFVNVSNSDNNVSIKMIKQ